MDRLRSIAVCVGLAFEFAALPAAAGTFKPSQSGPGSFTLSVTTACSPPVALAWTAAPNEVTSYQIYRNQSILSTVAPDTLRYADNNALPLTSYHYFVRAIGPGGTSQSNEVTAIADPSVCDALMPDLVALDIALSTLSARAGNTISVGMIVKNGGNATSSATTARIRFSHGPSMNTSDPVLATVVLPALGAGASFQSTTNVIVPAVAAGTYSLFVSLDEEHVSGDTNFDNNVKRSSLLTVADRIPPRHRAATH